MRIRRSAVWSGSVRPGPAGLTGLAAAGLATLALAAPLDAGELDLAGAIELELRGFPSAPAHDDQLDGAQASWVLAPELGWRGAERRHQLRVVPYLRLDGRDDERDHFDLRQAYWRRVGDGWESVVGVDRVFWGVAESRHLVDVVNQVDAAADVDEEDRLGQPMIALTGQRSWGSVSLYLLLGFRERTFPGREGRLRGPLPVDEDAARYGSSAGADRLDLALRWSHYVGAWDLGLSYFHGTGREPRLLPASAGDRLLPFYDVIRQASIDVQHTRGAWLFKLEALAREGQGRTFGAAVAGFEYTLYQLLGAADLGLLVEYLWDDRDPDPLVAPATLFEDDLFLGARLALNDVRDTALLAGAIVDRDERSWALFVEAERRLADRLAASLEARFFLDVGPGDPLALVARDDFLSLRVAYGF